jgi:O-antigen/teichoic acid export membrane protein
MPLSVLQAALADPGIRLLFAPRWYAAIPVVQILSLGMTMTMVGSPGVNFLQSQGRFRTVMVMAIGCAASLVGLVLVGARWGQMLGVACGVGIFHAVYGPVCMYVAVRAGGGSIRDVVRVYLPPMVATLVAVGIGYLLSTLLPEIPLRKWAFIAVTTTITAVIYIPMIRWLAPDGWGELSAQLGRLFRSMRPSRSAPATPL